MHNVDERDVERERVAKEGGCRLQQQRKTDKRNGRPCTRIGCPARHRSKCRGGKHNRNVHVVLVRDARNLQDARTEPLTTHAYAANDGKQRARCTVIPRRHNVTQRQHVRAKLDNEKQAVVKRVFVSTRVLCTGRVDHRRYHRGGRSCRRRKYGRCRGWSNRGSGTS